jgi:hypothetical protein
VKKNLNGALSEIIKKLYDYQKHREINDFVKAITEGISAAFWVLSVKFFFYFNKNYK